MIFGDITYDENNLLQGEGILIKSYGEKYIGKFSHDRFTG
jgi:hypothetical protein